MAPSSGSQTTDELTDAWEACALGRGITHEEHLRIAWTLLRRHGRQEGGRRIAEGTRRNCAALGVPERFDERLSERWIRALVHALDEGDDTFEGLMGAHPELAQSDLLGQPSWRQT